MQLFLSFSIDHYFSLRSLGLMLTASGTAPNPPQEDKPVGAAAFTHRLPPGPNNWRGVTHGLKDVATLLQRHFYTQAEELLLQLLEFTPMEGRAWHLLGRCHQAQERHAKALECFERAAHCYAQLAGDTAPPASARLARLLWEQGEKETAHAMLEALLKNQPDDLRLRALQQEWMQQERAQRGCQKSETEANISREEAIA